MTEHVSRSAAPRAGAHSGLTNRAVRAVLGPTNTGKTHLAMERLLAHSSGIIGFPLRLLARENYDRMVARKGASQVALITGEEKIIPPHARWFSCTVEAMPLDRDVEFVAVDEIQLCADPDRGHIFTDRLLHARGRSETIFLGSETIRPLLQALVPHAIVESRPRLSQLTYAGHRKLARLPPRSAVVAFSTNDVYALAEMIRSRRGGCAVVMGRLSPRTRNAQVALYQEKEVDFLVATDAIGMGLNMDVDHVGFAGLSKFDGHRPRALLPGEVAQIAGRAGRGMRDGTFGTTAECRPMPPQLVEAVETHSFEPLGQLFWRNENLDFSHLDALVASLQAPPRHRALVRGNDASDLLTLRTLAADPEIRGRAARGSRLRLLWECCQLPDFRKLYDESHVRLVRRLFTQLTDARFLPVDFMASQMAAMSRTDGDIDTLMARLSGIRTWSYIAARADWVDDAKHWQDSTREIEDKLSDVLHERLTARFVDRRATHLLRRLEDADKSELLSAVTKRGEVVVEGHPVGELRGFSFSPDPMAEGPEKQIVLRAARRALREEMPRRVAALERADSADFTLSDDLQIAWDANPVARLMRGHALLRPTVRMLSEETLDSAERERARQRLQRWLDELVGAELAPLFIALGHGKANAALRGPLHLLEEAGGVLMPAPELLPETRLALKRAGIQAGRFAMCVPGLLKPRPARLRARLLALWHGLDPASPLPAPERVSQTRPSGLSDKMAHGLGWISGGALLVRIDVAERLAAELILATRRGPIPLPTDISSRLSAQPGTLPAMMEALGLRLAEGKSLDRKQFGPPTPSMLHPPRKARKFRAPRPAAKPEPPREGPFSVLAQLRGEKAA